MCHFITLIVPTDDTAAVSAVMERHGRAANPIDNPSICKVLRDGEHQYLTTRGHCDCGTVLAPRYHSREAFEDRLAKEYARLRRKGWSESKVARAIDDKRKANTKADGRGADSLELWNAALHDLRNALSIPYAGLLVRLYSGAIATEAFTATRREIKEGVPWQEALASMEQDEVTIFR